MEYIQIKQDSYKVINQRSSTQILDFLGDIGGFQGAIILILVYFGEYFSAKFFIAQVAEDLYQVKKRKQKGNS